MRSSRARVFVLALVALLATGLPALADLPDCTGISGIFPANADLTGQLATVRIASGLDSPVGATSPPGDTERLFVLEQDGRIRIIKNDVLLATSFMDINSITSSSGDEEGLLGLAFHPDYESNGWFFVYHTNNSGNNVVARYTRDSVNPDLGDTATRVEVILFNHPTFGNHNGGGMAFGADGHLYIATGDGGNSCDPGPGTLGNAQSLSSNLGKVLRLNVDSLPYTTAGNPFDGVIAGNDEIWSYGWRNPWRITFDRATGAQYVGDVGQFVFEEVNCTPDGVSGGNHGWVNYEGNQCAPHPSSCTSSGGCGGIAVHAAPIRAYSQGATGGCTVIGGYVYRGCRMAQLDGTYFYGDYCADFINSFRTDSSCSAAADIARTADLTPNIGSIGSITTFGEDAQGELYVLDRGGEVFKILPDLSIMETSGPGAPQLTIGDDMVWEDLQASSSQPIDSYRVYRARNFAAGPYECVQKTDAQTTCSNGVCRWVGGDPSTPNPNKIYFYLIAAENTAGVQSTVGTRSDGTLRVINTAALCPS